MHNVKVRNDRSKQSALPRWISHSNNARFDVNRGKCVFVKTVLDRHSICIHAPKSRSQKRMQVLMQRYDQLQETISGALRR